VRFDFSAFLYRRLSKIITCTFNFSENRKIKLSDKHHIAGFQDVFVNAFYWDTLMRLNSAPGNVLDLGANLGYFSLLVEEFRRYKAFIPSNYVLVEANPHLIKRLEENLILFGIKEYKIVQAVAGPLLPSVKFYLSKRHVLSSSVSKQKGNVEIEIRTLQIGEIEKVCDGLIKIDIEGAEYELVHNFAPYLTRAKCILFELHGNKDQNDQLINVFLDLEYKICVSKIDTQSGFHLISFQKKEKDL
jgi:FkbM family methyltransferase